MVNSPTGTRDQGSFVPLVSNSIGYVAVLAAVATGIVHLLLGSRVMGFNQTMGILFVLNGLGFLGGTGLYLGRFWRRELYLVAAGYAIVTVLAFFAMQGVGMEAFYMRGDLNLLAVASKLAELVVAAIALYLYAES